MTEPKLQLVDRSSNQFNSVKAARKQGHVPGVLYSKGQPTQQFFVNEGDLTRFINHFGISRKVTITLNNEKSFAILKDIQRDSLKNQFIHLDLQTLDENEKIRVTSAIHVVNRDAIEKEDKVLQIQMNEVDLLMYPRFMPESIEIDAALLLDKDSVTLADLNIANDKNIEILSELDSVVATLVYAQAPKVEADDADDTVDPAAVEIVGETKE